MLVVGKPGGQSRRRSVGGKEQTLGRTRVRMQEGGPNSWLVRREGGSRELGC